MCDHRFRVPDTCFGTEGGGGGGGGGLDAVVEVAPSTTITTTKPPRPAKLDDVFEFEINCAKRQCGLFPNVYGACDTFVICVNGKKIEKKCNGGQLFDVKTKECQPAAIATCWSEPNAGPHRIKRGDHCPFHGFKETTPIETLPESAVLQAPVVTNFGSWQKWKDCPKGTYVTGLYAWRRVLQSRKSGSDHIGIYSLSLRCQSPGGSETNMDIESLAPGGRPENWPFYYMCAGGAMVGFQLNSVAPNGFYGSNGYDEIATDNIKGYCSCSDPIYKPYEQAIYAPQSGNRGTWTETQFCKKHQSVCGMQTQMQDYKEYLIGKYDNTGLNNMKVRCCDVPDPLENFKPSEERIHIRDCDNTKSDEGLRCDFESAVGLGLDYNGQQKIIDFYSSVGYDFASMKEALKTKVISGLESVIKSGRKLEYSWDDIVALEVGQDEAYQQKTMFVKPFEKVELYQIVGKCGYFTVRTNRFLRIVKTPSGSVLSEDFFEV